MQRTENAPSACPANEHGTAITLTELEQTIHFPSAEKFRQLLMRDYGREESFAIFVNGKRLDLADVGGTVTERTAPLEDLGTATLRFTVAEDRQRIKGAGIILRVKGNVVGRPTFLDLDNAEDFPKSLLDKIYGEIEADGLEPDVTADFAHVVENSEGFKRIKAWAAPIIRDQVSAIYQREMQLAQARLKQKINRRLASLPEYKREFADRALNKLLHKFYGESEERLEPIVNVVLDALEQDNYRLILERIDAASDLDVAAFANALEQFGLIDLALIAQQASHRLRLLDHLDDLRVKPHIDELVMHKAIEQNLWLLGAEYITLASNKSFHTIIKDVLDKIYVGERASERPDLLIASNVVNRHVLIEFKNPTMTLSYKHYQQAISYRHELRQYFTPKIDVWLIGGSRDERALPDNHEPNIHLATYAGIIANARTQIEWLLKELAKA